MAVTVYLKNGGKAELQNAVRAQAAAVGEYTKPAARGDSGAKDGFVFQGQDGKTVAEFFASEIAGYHLHGDTSFGVV